MMLPKGLREKQVKDLILFKRNKRRRCYSVFDDPNIKAVVKEKELYFEMRYGICLLLLENYIQEEIMLMQVELSRPRLFYT